MQIETLRYLLAIAEHGSTRKAAEELNTSFQNVSRVLQGAEKELACQLFQRTSKGLLPTDNGQLALKCAAEMLALYDEMCGRLHRGDENQPKASRLTGKLQLRSSIIVSNGVADDLLVEFAKLYPKVQVNITEADAYSPITAENGQLYFVPRTIRDVRQQAYPTIPLLSDKVALLISEDSPLSKQKTISLKKVASLPLALIAKGDWEDSLFGRIFQEQGYVPQAPFYLNSIIGFQKLVGSGQYVGLSTEKLCRKLMSGKKHPFQILSIRDDDVEIYHCLTIRDFATLSATERKFVQFVLDYYHIENISPILKGFAKN